MSFSLFRLIFPKNLETFRSSSNGYLSAQIRVLDASDKKFVGSLMTFKGCLPSYSPHFIYTGKLKRQSINSDVWEPAQFNQAFQCVLKNPGFLTRQDLLFIVDELSIEHKKVANEVRKFAAALETDTVTLASFTTQAFFGNIIENTCDYFRLERDAPIRELFSVTFKRGRRSYDLDQDHRIRMLPKERVERLAAMIKETPWLLLFSKFSKLFKLNPISFETYQKQTNIRTPPTIYTALSYYAFVLKLRKDGHTLFYHDKVLEIWPKRPFIEEGLSFLEFKAIVFVDKERRAFALLEDVKNAQLIVDRLKTIEESEKIVATRDSDEVPCIGVHPAELTGEQRAFQHHVRTNRFTFLQGGPGTGKSEVGLVWLLQEYAAPLIVTYTGMMVDAGQQRMGNRSEVMYTIHYIIHTARHVKHGPKWLENFDILVIDEASNVDTKLFAQLLEVVPSVCKIVLIGDLGQIYPISPGCPFADLVATFPQHSFMLTENKRVQPGARALADASQLIRSGNSTQIQYLEGILTLLPRSEDIVEQVLENLCKTPDDIMKIHFVVLRNLDRHSINKKVEQWLLDRCFIDASKKVVITSKCTLYVGQKITFTKNIKIDKGCSVRNGELGQVQSFKHDAKGGIIVSLCSGKTVLIHAERGVPHNCISLGYASTSNKSQGSEWKMVVFYMHEGVLQQDWWTREYPYVGISRAKQQCIIVGTAEELQRICEKKARKRHTVLEYLLKTVELPAVFFEDTSVVRELKLLPMSAAVVPYLSDYAPKTKIKKSI